MLRNAMHLLPCPSCSRHVLSTEVTCPFCSSLLPDWMAQSVAPALPKARLGRAALLCAGVAGTAATACGAVVESDSMTPAAGMSATAGAGNASAGMSTGGMGNAGAASMGGMGGMNDDIFLPTPEYGVPALPPETGGSPSMGGASGVGRDPIDDVGVPIYGLPPVESE